MSPDLAELRRLLDEVEGRDEYRRLPWHAWNRGIGYELHYGATCRDEMTPAGYCNQVNYGQRETFGQREAALIVAAVNALPALLDAAEEHDALRAERDALAAAVERPGIGSDHGSWKCDNLACGVLTYAAEWCPGCGSSHRREARP